MYITLQMLILVVKTLQFFFQTYVNLFRQVISSDNIGGKYTAAERFCTIQANRVESIDL